MDKGVGVAELCAEYWALAIERADLDRRIQAVDAVSPIDLGNGPAAPSRAESVSEADTLWIRLDDILNQQIAIVAALVDQRASDANELRGKAELLATLLESNTPTEADLAQSLSRSVVRDVISLFP